MRMTPLSHRCSRGSSTAATCRASQPACLLRLTVVGCGHTRFPPLLDQHLCKSCIDALDHAAVTTPCSGRYGTHGVVYECPNNPCCNAIDAGHRRSAAARQALHEEDGRARVSAPPAG